jgi:hypothetical protein
MESTNIDELIALHLKKINFSNDEIVKSKATISKLANDIKIKEASILDLETQIEARDQTIFELKERLQSKEKTIIELEERILDIIFESL